MKTNVFYSFVFQKNPYIEMCWDRSSCCLMLVWRINNVIQYYDIVQILLIFWDCMYRAQTLHQKIYITKTRLYNFDPLKPHFYIVKLGFTGVYIIFLILLKNIDCGYSLEPPRWGGSNEYAQSMFWAGIWKLSEFFIWKFSLFWL